MSSSSTMSARRSAALRLPAGMASREEEGSDSEEEEIIEGASDSSEEEDDNGLESSDEEDAELPPRRQRPAKAVARSRARAEAAASGPASMQLGRPARLELLGDEEVRAEGDVSSDEEHERNTIGNVPLHWYDEFDHIGYDKAGKKIAKKAGMDEVDKFLASKDDPFYRRTVYDAKNDESVVLTDRELLMVKRMLESKFPEAGMDAEPDYVDYFSGVVEELPLSLGHEPKRRFVPSKWERMKVLKIVQGMKAGVIALGSKPPPRKPDFFLLWGEDDVVDELKKRRKAPKHLPAPKVALPDHRESYHPPAEYLPTEAEVKEWTEAHPDDRKLNYLPQDYGVMRKIPAYKGYVTERFERCLDLYLCPRKEKLRLNIDPESLVPKLPSPSELRPYPTTVGLTYFGHSGRVRALAVDPAGELLASGGDDCKLNIWEVESGRLLASYELASPERAEALAKAKARKARRKAAERAAGEGDDDDDEEDEEPVDEEAITALAWNPQSKYCVIAASVGDRVVLVHAGVAGGASAEQMEASFRLLKGGAQPKDADANGAGAGAGAGAGDGDGDVDKEGDGEESADAQLRRLRRESKDIATWKEGGDMASAALLGKCWTSVDFVGKGAKVTSVAWHPRGEYLATVRTAAAASAQVTVHNVAKRMSQRPLKAKADQQTQCVLFHPSKPVLFVATKQVVHVYHLVHQRRLKQLRTGVRWISTMAIHPDGDNLAVGSYDRRLAWFDLDLSDKPWKTLKYHKRALRRVQFHSKLPLMASAADDGTVHVFHARVFDDFAKDPFVVPVKVLRGHTQTLEGLGVLDIAFHPTQPWIFSAGADGRVQLFQNLN